MYSSTMKPADLARSYLKGQKDPADEQEFWNSKMGLPHIVSGAAVTEDNLDECRQIENFRNGQVKPRGDFLITMGVDVGKQLHVEIDEWRMPNQRYTADLNIECIPKVLYQTTVLHFEELDRLMIEYGIHACVIDANPERRKAYEFGSRFCGHIKMCLYGRGITDKQIHVMKDKTGQVQDEHLITVDRTSWLDLSLGRFKRKAILLPFDVNREYKDHIKALVRIYEKDKDGNPTGKYVNGNSPDHYGHARNYAELALPFAASAIQPRDIEGVL